MALNKSVLRVCNPFDIGYIGQEDAELVDLLLFVRKLRSSHVCVTQLAHSEMALYYILYVKT